jgi:hypothetical protein
MVTRMAMKNPVDAGFVVRYGCLVPWRRPVTVVAKVLTVSRQTFNRVRRGQFCIPRDIVVRSGEAFGCRSLMNMVAVEAPLPDCEPLELRRVTP